MVLPLFGVENDTADSDVVRSDADFAAVRRPAVVLPATDTTGAVIIANGMA